MQARKGEDVFARAESTSLLPASFMNIFITFGRVERGKGNLKAGTMQLPWQPDSLMFPPSSFTAEYNYHIISTFPYSLFSYSFFFIFLSFFNFPSFLISFFLSHFLSLALLFLFIHPSPVPTSVFLSLKFKLIPSQNQSYTRLYSR